MTVVLTVAALDLGIDQKINYMAKVCKGYAVSHGNRQIQVPVKSTLDPTGNGSIADDAVSLSQAIWASPETVEILAYSRGAQVASELLEQWKRNPIGAPPTEKIKRFTLIGNPWHPIGRPPWVNRRTPTDTPFTVVHVSRKGDGWCDWDDTNKAKSIAGLFIPHTSYWNVDLVAALKAADSGLWFGRTAFVKVP